MILQLTMVLAHVTAQGVCPSRNMRCKEWGEGLGTMMNGLVLVHLVPCIPSIRCKGGPGLFRVHFEQSRGNKICCPPLPESRLGWPSPGQLWPLAASFCPDWEG